MGAERRRHKRVDCNFPIKLYVQGHPKPVDAEVRNISVGGAFVVAQEKIPEGSNVLLEFQQAELSMIHARIAKEKPIPEAKVPPSVAQTSVARWVQRVSGTGVGVEFVNVRPEVLEFLGELITILDKENPLQ